VFWKIPSGFFESRLQQFLHALLGMKADSIVIRIFPGPHLAACGCQIS
jgi:hypothetical protein